MFRIFFRFVINENVVDVRKQNVSMFRKKIQIMKKKIDENFAKGYIRTNWFLIILPILFARQPGGNSLFT